MTAEALARVQRLRDDCLSLADRGFIAPENVADAAALTALLGERDALRDALERWITDGYTDNETPLDAYGQEVVREVLALLSAGDLGKVG